jgi:uncharacterized membrane protein
MALSNRCTMLSLTWLDLAALAYFLGAWVVYSFLVGSTAHGIGGLNNLMHQYREQWMDQMLARDMRMVDGQVTASLQNGAAFFASTSLIAIGGALTLLRSTDEILTLVTVLPFGLPATRGTWDTKMLGVAVIFAYAFFKFAWSYRLFNYVAIMIGAAPPSREKNTPHAKQIARRAAEVCADAGRHFNRGQRAFFFALGYLGWFLGPLPLIATTTGVVLVMYRRQFSSDSRRAFGPPLDFKAARRGPAAPRSSKRR